MAKRQTTDTPTPDVVNAYAMRMVRVKAIELCEKPEFAGDEREDIEQELTLFLLRQAGSFDPDKSTLNTFINRVIRSRICTLQRDRVRKRRLPASFGGVKSTADTIGRGCEATTIQETLTPTDRDRRLGRESRDPNADIRLAIDVRDAIESLPAELQPLARSLMIHRRVEATEILKISQRAYTRQLREIGEHFAALGLNFDDQSDHENAPTD